MISTTTRTRTRARRRAIAAIAAISAAAIVSGCSADVVDNTEVPRLAEGALPEATVAELQGAVEHAMAATGSSGAIVGVWVPWSGSWVAGLGSTAAEGGSEVTTDMTFRIGDVTRPMVCDILFGLAAQGKVDLDESISDLVVGIAHLDDATVLDVCNGTAGIADVPKTVREQWVTLPERVWSPRELASFGLGAPRATAKGEFLDSAANYLLLGLAMERAGNATASELITTYVSDPLDLAATQLDADTSAKEPPSPALPGYVSRPVDGVLDCAAPTDITKVSNSTGYTAGGVTSTITDLGTYTLALAQNTRFGSTAENRFADPKPVTPSSPSWFQAAGGATLAGSLVGQYGAAPGYLTAAYADPETGMTVAVVLNNSAAGKGMPTYLAWELAAIASKAPATGDQAAPEFGLPWTAEQYHDVITTSAVCPVG